MRAVPLRKACRIRRIELWGRARRGSERVRTAAPFTRSIQLVWPIAMGRLWQARRARRFPQASPRLREPDMRSRTRRDARKGRGATTGLALLEHRDDLGREV